METRVQVGYIVLLQVIACMSQSKIVNNGGSQRPDPRLGLIATQLGLNPVAGYTEPGSAPATGFSTHIVNNEGGGSSNCQCLPPPKCQAYKGDGKLPSDGSGLYGGGKPGHNPPTDGSGLLDLRIVNRPPGQGGVQCTNGQVYCCGPQVTKPVESSPEYQGQGGSVGYANCGSRSLIEVAGRQLQYGDAKFGAYPWMAVILGTENNYVGAGALISPYFVLTAAHKLKSWRPNVSMKVRFGEWDAKDDNEPYKNVEIPIEKVIVHPRFNSQNLENDIALIKLSSPIDTKRYPHIKSVCLPEKGSLHTGKRCWVAGFGKDAFGGGRHSYIMKEVDLPILDGKDCERRFRTTRLGSNFYLNQQSFLCAGGEEGKDACTGDGGSPLVCNLGKWGGWQVVGLVAWGVGCADYGIPGAYVNVPNYLDWINQEVYKY